MVDALAPGEFISTEPDPSSAVFLDYGSDLIFTAMIVTGTPEAPTGKPRRVLLRRTPDGARSIVFDEVNPPEGTPPSAVLPFADPSHGPQTVALGLDGTIALILEVEPLDNSPPDSVLLRLDPSGTASVVARTGDTVPGLPTNLRVFHMRNTSVTPDGTVVFDGFLDDTQSEVNLSAILAQSPGAPLRAVAYEGQPLPGQNPPVLSRIRIASGPERPNRMLAAPDGRVIFLTYDSTNGNPIDRNLCETVDGEVRVLRNLSEPLPLPGKPRVERVSNFQTDSAGNLIFVAFGRHADNARIAAIIQHSPDGSERVLASSSSVLPDVTGPLVGRTIQAAVPGAVPAAPGTAAYEVNLFTQDAGYPTVFMNDAAGRSRLVISGNEPLTVQPGDERRILSLRLQPNDGYPQGRPKSTDNRGRVVVLVIFDDFSEALVLATPNNFFRPADVNGDGVLDLADIIGYINQFLTHEPIADMNGDGVLDLGDISAFVTLFLD